MNQLRQHINVLGLQIKQMQAQTDRVKVSLARKWKQAGPLSSRTRRQR
ncbi:hypothetical protein, unlikely [Trypanosoma brucei brucei TREU927]|uniref:Uncharacterized protein n=1 Tax=Trypanosoma brucei brucei (strain 927/4 GUTat10.1) TaxID=185431 RepID=Q38ER0_TRYB2|nr:hypothetical protein, unlikely [Trypanosoma brucei brucei TREU927]EAN76710.1 hypothetical protein, unlikely [Trypanosoma brucei brucei TREU927]